MPRGKTPLEDRFVNYFEPITESGCWIWTGCVDKDGYGKTSYRDSKGERHHIRAHRASYTLYKKPIPEGLVVCHKCDVTSCVNPDHLFTGTASDNNKDRTKKGRGIKHEKHHKAKITKEKALKIRALYATGKYTQRILAEKEMTSENIVHRVVNNICWVGV